MRIGTSPRYGDPGAGLATVIREYRSGLLDLEPSCQQGRLGSLILKSGRGRRIFQVDYMSSK